MKKNVQKAGVVPEICLVENILMGKKALKKVFFDYMERNPEVDGIFCTSDMIAAQLLAECLFMKQIYTVKSL